MMYGKKAIGIVSWFIDQTNGTPAVFEDESMWTDEDKGAENARPFGIN